MNERKRIYWDACAWLGLLNKEADRTADLELVWKKAEHGEVEIWTSAIGVAEVYKMKCEGKIVELSPEHDAKIDALFDQDFVQVVQVDFEIAKLAKILLRKHDKLKKPSDGIHLATAVYWDLDQFHTYDNDDILGLDVDRSDGVKLVICKPNMIDGNNLFNQENGDLDA